MKLSNFKLIKTTGSSIVNRSYYATVDCTTGTLWFKKTVNRQICREFVGYWHFVDNGSHTPGLQAETLARGWKAQTGEEC